MYQSPIEIVTNSFIKEQNERLENEIVYRASMETGINIDRDELLKALRHDRNQYDKGYADGIREYAERLKENFTEQWCGSKYELIHSWIDNLVEEMLKGGDN